jgi:hypothetical protein
MARHLVRLLAAAPAQALPIKEAKRRFCGETTPISDLHAAMGYAKLKGWIGYSRDYRSMNLQPLGRMAAT